MLNFVTYFSHHESGIRTYKPFLNNFRKEKRIQNNLFFYLKALASLYEIETAPLRARVNLNMNVCEYQQRKQFPKYFIGKHLSLVDNIDY